VHWIAGDITEVVLEAARYDLWHDRAVFHFLTKGQDRAIYARQVALRGPARRLVIVATFGPEGPGKCSDLDVVRYDAEGLHGELGPNSVFWTA
jgi:hypothetical protein